MKEHTKVTLLNYLKDDSKWPFLWDGTMGGKYSIGGMYHTILAAIRDEHDKFVLTPFGYRIYKTNKVTEYKYYEQPTNELIDAMGLILARDRIVRRLVKKIDEQYTSNGPEQTYVVMLEQFAEFVENQPTTKLTSESLKEAIAKLPQPKFVSTYVPYVALAQSITVSDNMLHVHLKDRRVIGAPIDWYPLLQEASPEDQNIYAIVGGGLNVYWPTIDLNILVSSLLAGAEQDEYLTPKERGSISDDAI